jgi:tryptophan-rich sensory protein
MPVAKWHPGKLIILWSWGTLFAALALTSFLATRATESSKISHTVTFLAAIFILIALSAITWRWLTGRESNPAQSGEPPDQPAPKP